MTSFVPNDSYGPRATNSSLRLPGANLEDVLMLLFDLTGDR
jgi:hypothetical protein